RAWQSSNASRGPSAPPRGALPIVTINLDLVPGVGLEPTLPCEKGLLRPPSLPFLHPGSGPGLYGSSSPASTGDGRQRALELVGGLAVATLTGERDAALEDRPGVGRAAG